MRFSLLATATLCATAFATPSSSEPLCRHGTRRPECKGKPQSPYWRPGMKHDLENKCMGESDAEAVANIFQSIIRGYTKKQATEALTEDFIDYSSAVSIIINKGAAVPKDLTQPIFTSRGEFMEGHGKQQPIPFETLDVWHNCNGTVSMRWLSTRSGLGQATEAAAIPVPGLVVLETEPAEEGNPYNYRIHTIYSEFNTAAWLVNLGVFTPEGSTIPVPNEKREEAWPMHWSDVGLI